MAFCYKKFTIIKDVAFLLLLIQIRKEAVWSRTMKTAFEIFQARSESYANESISVVITKLHAICFSTLRGLGLKYSRTSSIHPKVECWVGQKRKLDQILTTRVFLKIEEFGFKIWPLSRYP